MTGSVNYTNVLIYNSQQVCRKTVYLLLTFSTYQNNITEYQSLLTLVKLLQHHVFNSIGTIC